MAWQTSTTITNATSTNLTAGAEATGADYGSIKVQEGGILNTATVSSAGYVYVGSAASATELTVLTGGSAVISGGYLSGGTFYGSLRLSRNTVVNATVYDVAISSGGYLWTQPGTATITDAHIYSAGSAFFNDAVFLTNVVVENGGKFAMGGNTLYIVDEGGKTSIPVGAVYSGTGANKFYQWGSDFAVANGVVSGLSIGAATVGGKNSGSVNFTGYGLTVDGATIAGAYNASGVFQSRSAGIYDGAVKDAVVSNLGAVVLHRSSYISNATVLAGGTIYLSNGNSATQVTVNDGGRITVRGGAWIVGSNNHIAAGTWSGCADFYTDENGVGHNLTLNGSTVNFADITLSGVAISAGNGSLCVRSGATAFGVSAAASGAGIVHSGGTISGWSFDVNGKGSVYSGGSAFAVRVYDGGSMALSGASISGVTLDNATMTLSGARVDNAAISAGGTLTMETSSFISGAVVGNGGSLYVSNTNSVTGITTEEGATLIMRGGAKMIGGNNHIAANTWSGGGAFYTDENGVGHDLTLNGVTIHFVDMTLSGVSMMSNGQIRVSSGTTVYGLSGTGRTSTYIYAGGEVYNYSLLYGLSGATYQAGTAYITSSAFVDGMIAESTAVVRLATEATLLNANIAAGATLVYSSAAKLGGENTNIAAGTISAYAADGTLVALTDAYVEAGAAKGFDLRGANGKRLEVDFLDGITVGSVNVGSGARLVLGSGVTVDGTLNVSSGGDVVGTVVVAAGGKLYASSATTLTDVVVQEGAAAAVFSSAVINNLTVVTENAALTTVSARQAVLNGFELQGGEGTNSARISAMTGAVLNNGIVRSNGQEIVVVGAVASNTYIDDKGGEQLWGGAAYGTVVGSGGSQTVHNSKGAFGTAYDTVVLSGGRLTGNRLVTGGVTYWGGFVSRAVVNSGGSLSFNSNNSAFDVNVRNGGTVIVGDSCGFGGSNTRIAVGAITSNAAAYADGAGRLFNYSVVKGYEFNVLSGLTLTNGTVSSGGTLICHSGATLDGVRVVSGAQLTLEAGATTKEVTLDFLSKAGNDAALINDLSLLSPDAVVRVTGLSLGKTYTVTDNGVADAKYTVTYLGFDTEIGVGEYINPLDAGRKYTVGANGTTVKAEAHDMSGEILTTEAADLTTSGATINSGDRALKWEGVSLASGGVVTFADAAITGDAWLDIDSASVAAGATLYGATGNYTGTIRYLVHGAGGTIGNFAAGAASNGSVGGVELVAYKNTFAGMTYLGGMGTVTGQVRAVISSGNTLNKDFYAGALANYAKTGAVTSVGGVDVKIAMKNDDTDLVKGNIYGAASVKAGTVTTATTVHSVGGVKLTLAGGTAAKSDVCVFAGGYATGHDAAKAAPVYTVESVTLDVSGGDWGTARGGRGVFGGAMASDNIGSDGVYAKVGNVSITISGGKMGNVYGGGWAQKDALSEVGNVSITITGGTITNVFGGGSHSTSGGSTVAGDVTITVSGGTITGDIYARGQLDGDTTGTAAVIFTGAANFDCGVYGYSYVGGEAGGATLSFNGYTGTFSGTIGGFDSIAFGDGATATFDAADVSNGAWIFDVANRDAGLTGTALLNWTAADFTGDTITLKLGATATEWTLIDAASTTAYNKFDVDGVASELVLDQKIDGGAYDGWGFTLEDTALKFKHLA